MASVNSEWVVPKIWGFGVYPLQKACRSLGETWFADAKDWPHEIEVVCYNRQYPFGNLVSEGICEFLDRADGDEVVLSFGLIAKYMHDCGSEDLSAFKQLAR